MLLSWRTLSRNGSAIPQRAVGLYTYLQHLCQCVKFNGVMEENLRIMWLKDIYYLLTSFCLSCQLHWIRMKKLYLINLVTFWQESVGYNFYLRLSMGATVCVATVHIFIRTGQINRTSLQPTQYNVQVKLRGIFIFFPYGIDRRGISYYCIIVDYIL